MKKLIAGILTAALCCTPAVPAFAAEITTDGGTGDTTLSTTKVAAYIVVIPETAEIVFDTETNPIGAIEYREGNLEPDAFVTVTLSTQTELANKVDSTYTIAYEIKTDGEEGAFTSVEYNEETAAGTETPLTANITKQAWEEAKSGDYEATLTFTIAYTNPHAQPTVPQP